jgi:hypothetical protein
MTKACSENENLKEKKAYKAKNLRYKKAALSMIQRDRIEDEIYEIMTVCDDMRYFMGDDEALLDAMNGDDEEAFEFKMLFGDLSALCERLDGSIRDNYVTEHFDDFFVGLLGNRYDLVGYDYFQEDYYSLTRFEGDLAQTESGKRLMRLTKEQIIAVAGQCIGILMSFLDLRHKYDYLKASFDVLKDQNTSILDSIKAIEQAYEKAEADGFCGENGKAFDWHLSGLPDKYWIT